MGFLDEASNLLNRGVANAGRSTRSLAIKAQLNDLKKQRESLCAQLGAALYEQTHSDVAFRAPHESVYKALEALDDQCKTLQAELATIEQQAHLAQAASGRRCPVCATPLGPDDVFCVGCGTRVDVPTAPVVPAAAAVPVAADGASSVETVPSCSHCGAPLAPEAQFCVNCGAPVVVAAAPEDAPAATTVATPEDAPVAVAATSEDAPAPEAEAEMPAPEVAAEAPVPETVPPTEESEATVSEFEVASEAEPEVTVPETGEPEVVKPEEVEPKVACEAPAPEVEPEAEPEVEPEETKPVTESALVSPEANADASQPAAGLGMDAATSQPAAEPSMDAAVTQLIEPIAAPMSVGQQSGNLQSAPLQPGETQPVVYPVDSQPLPPTGRPVSASAVPLGGQQPSWPSIPPMSQPSAYVPASAGKVALSHAQAPTSFPVLASAAPTAAPMPIGQRAGLCGNCGYENNADAIFCRNCGNRL